MSIRIRKLRRLTVLFLLIFTVGLFVFWRGGIKNLFSTRNRTMHSLWRGIQIPRRCSKPDRILAILVIAHNRPESLKSLLLELRAQAQDLQSNRCISQVPIIVSIDSTDPETLSVARELADTVYQAPHDKLQLKNVRHGLRGYYYIARHYKFALDFIFKHNPRFKDVVVVEDDLAPSPDFLDYFRTLRPLLYFDSSVMTISAWNDNGISGSVSTVNPYLVHLTDFFPGLGWLVTRRLWKELRPKWPEAYWDDWLRDPKQRKNRPCVRPEVSRVSMLPESSVGVSGGLFYDGHLSKVSPNIDPSIRWSKAISNRDLLELIPASYNAALERKMESCGREIKIPNHSLLWPPDEPCAVQECNDMADCHDLLTRYELMTDIRGELYRTSYKNVVQTVHNGTRIFIKVSSS